MPGKSYIIFSTIELYRGNTAGSARMLNFARSLAKKNAVYLFSFFDTMGSDGKTIASKRLKKEFSLSVESPFAAIDIFRNWPIFLD